MWPPRGIPAIPGAQTQLNHTISLPPPNRNPPLTIVRILINSHLFLWSQCSLASLIHFCGDCFHSPALFWLPFSILLTIKYLSSLSRLTPSLSVISHSLSICLILQSVHYISLPFPLPKLSTKCLCAFSPAYPLYIERELAMFV